MNRSQFGHLFLLLIFAGITMLPLGTADAQTATTNDDVANQPTKKNPKKDAKEKKAQSWSDLTGKWSECQFGGDGPIKITNKLIKLGYGDPITGVKWDGDILRDNYEIEVEARRVEGFDFFCAITFPIAKSQASLVLGGWGGGVVGISSIDDRDASDNETTMFTNFDNGTWYRARIRIEETRLAVWLDDKLQFEVPRKEHTFDIRYEMDPCVPFGLANYQCESEIRVVRVRPLNKAELGIDLSAEGKKAEAEK